MSWKIAAAVVATIGLALLISGIALHFRTGGSIRADAITMEIVLKYFVGIILIGAAKHMTYCNECLSAIKGSKKKRRR